MARKQARVIKPNATVRPARSLREEDFFSERLGRSSMGMEFQPQGMSLKESTGECQFVLVKGEDRLLTWMFFLNECLKRVSVFV